MNTIIIPNGKYNDAVALMDAGNYTEAISAGSSHTVGLKSDGTVVAVGANEDGQRNVSKWKNIKLP